MLVTGFDIIYFWVARMLKMGLEFMGEVPFADVVIHGLVRTPDGRKMSKSLGNAIDPLDVIESHGADPLRLAIVQAAAPGQDVPFDMEWVEGARKFGNKLWNAARFVLGHIEPGSVPAAGGYPESPGPESAWILSRLAAVVDRFDELSDEYRFSDAYGLLYNFAWSEVFDWYLELSKAALADDASAVETRQTLGVVLRDLLKLFHPAIPVPDRGAVEGARGRRPAGRIVLAGPARTPLAALDGRLSGARRRDSAIPVLASAVTPPGARGSHRRSRVGCRAMVGTAAGIPRRRHRPSSAMPPTQTASPASWPAPCRASLPLEGVVDLDAERARLQRALATAEEDFAVADKKLSNPNFRDRAPADIVAKEEQKRAEAEATVAKLRAQLDELGDSLTYDEAVAYLDYHAGRGIRPGLAQIQGLLELMGNPHLTYPVVHVTGSKGKSSTAAMITMLAGRARSVGRHLHQSAPRAVEERLAYNGLPATAEEFAQAVADTRAFDVLVDDDPERRLTYFEFVTAVAFAWFADRAVDLGVIEVGLGGRLDATNVVQSAVAVVASIALEHTVLPRRHAAGDRHREGGHPQAGWQPRHRRTAPRGRLRSWRPGPPSSARPIWPTAATSSSSRRSRQSEAGTSASTGCTSSTTRSTSPSTGDTSCETPPWPSPPPRRCWAGRLTPRRCGRASPLSPVPGRLEVAGRRPLVVLDGAHTPESMAAGADALDEEFPPFLWKVVLGALGDKKLEELVAALAGITGEVFAVTAPSARGIPSSDVAAAARAAMPDREVHDCGSVADGVRAAVAAAGEDGADSRDRIHVCRRRGAYPAGEIDRS